MQRQRRWSKEWEHRYNCLRLITVFGRMTITLDQRQKVIRTVGVFFRPPWRRGAAPSCCFCYCSSCGVFNIPLPLDITPSPSLDAGLSYSALPASGAVFSLALCHQQCDPGILKKKKTQGLWARFSTGWMMSGQGVTAGELIGKTQRYCRRQRWRQGKVKKKNSGSYSWWQKRWWQNHQRRQFVFSPARTGVSKWGRL